MRVQQKIIERKFVIRVAVGLSVILMMSHAGERIASLLADYGFPYGAWVGVGIVALPCLCRSLLGVPDML